MNYRSTFYKLAAVLVILASTAEFSRAQFCDSLVPTFNVDLSASPIMNWTSPPIVRDGNCCGTTAPDNCLEFVITLHPQAIAVNFNIASGAIPPGALFYQINCGPPTPVGSPICLTGPGPHVLTFCKPGNNNNTFSVVSYSAPIIGPDLTLSAACQGFIYAQYYDETTVSWTSIAPGAVGAYDNLLSCTASCDTTYITAPVGAPPFVDYLVCGMDAGGCDPNPICDTIRVHFIPPVSVILSSPVTSLCPGETTTMTATAAGGSGGYTLIWSNGFGGTSQVLGPGTYTVDVQDTSGCFVATDQLTLVALPAPPVNAGPDQMVCDGAAVILSAGGATSYIWDNGVMDGQAFIPSIGSVTYTVSGTDNNGCTASDQVVVTVNPLPLVSAGTDVSVCVGSSVTLNGSGAVSYVWTGGVLDGQAFTPALGTSIYTVTGTDANGCVNTDDVQVLVNPLPVIDAGADQVLCQGESTTVNGTGASSLTWSGGILNNTPFTPALGTNTYVLTGIDGNGCQNTDDLTITVNPLPLVDAGADQIVCEGTAVVLSGSGAMTYVWNNGIADGVAFTPNVGATSYTLTGTDANGCVASDQVVVMVNPLPLVSAGNDVSVCIGNTVTLNGSGAVSYVWTGGILDGQPFTPALGTSVFTVSGTDANGCVNTDDVLVVVNPLPVIDAGADQVLCQGESTVVNGSGATTLSWSSGIQNNTAFMPPVGTTTYVLTGTDGNGCQNTDDLTITVNPLPQVDAGPDQIVCEGLSVIFDASGASTYVWSNGAANQSTVVLGVGTWGFTVVGTDANGCSNEDGVQFTVNPLPELEAGADISLCEGELYTLSAVSNGSISWNSGQPNGAVFNPDLGNTELIATATSTFGCIALDSLVVSVHENPIVIAQDVEICFGELAVLTAFGAESYVWTGGVTNGVGFYPESTQSYSVIGTDANGCTGSATAIVTVHDLPYVNFKILDLSLTTMESTTGFENLSQGATTYYWDFGDGSPGSTAFEPEHTFPGDQGGEYVITLTGYSEFGCPAQKIKYVHVFPDYTVYVPNTFTPDHNGQNEVFKPVMDGFDPQKYTLYIFNRWGDLIFESHDMEVGWDGTFAGQDFQVQDNVYVWKIIAGLKESSDTKIFVGHVALLK